MEELTADERGLVFVLLSREWVRIRHDPDMLREAAELEGILRKIQNESLTARGEDEETFAAGRR